MSGAKARNNKDVRKLPGGIKVLKSLEKYSKMVRRKKQDIPNYQNNEGYKVAYMSYVDFSELANELRGFVAYERYKAKKEDKNE